MRLFIAEKPNLAKAIANGLGNGRTESGCIRCGDDVVTWCFGHMLELAWPQEYKPEYSQWRREHLPIIPSEWKYKVKKDSAKQLAVIGSLLREADSVVNAGDPDREGQLLVDEVLEHFNYRGPVARIWLPSLDDKSVRIALNGIRDNTPYAPLRDAARARSLADWLVGINATRALTIKGREGGHSKTLSLGRVQTPTLALVVARDREITNFKPVDYFVLRASLTHAAGEFTATFVPSETQAGLDASGRLVDFTQVAAVLEQVNGVEGLVTESLRENKSKAAPLPHSLSSLQKAASSRFGMSAQEVLDTAQSLYERKLTTYPRTDCRYLPVEQYQEAAAVLAAHRAGIENLTYEFKTTLDGVSYHWIRIYAHLFVWDEDESVRMLVYRQNIDDEKRREQRLFEQMQHDSLTGLYNKAATQSCISKLLDDAPGMVFAFFILDIDGLGHSAGDEVLARFSDAVRAQFRPYDIVGRIGGDEFVAFAPLPDAAAADEKATALVEALRLTVPTDAGTCVISASVGVALATEAGRDFESLYRHADEALYRAKKAGKSRFARYED